MRSDFENFRLRIYRKFTLDISGGQNKRQLWRHFSENYRVSNKDEENY